MLGDNMLEKLVQLNKPTSQNKDFGANDMESDTGPFTLEVLARRFIEQYGDDADR
jgi:hypothetical protein